MSAIRYSSEIKSSVIAEVLAGKQVREVCSKYTISRTIFYRWFNAYKATIHTTQAKRSLKKLGKRSINAVKEHLILRTVIRHPDASLTQLAAQYDVNQMAIWRMLKKHQLNTKQLRLRYQLQFGKQVRRDVSYKERVLLLNRFKEGESVTSLCRDAHISRTIFYRWLKATKSHVSLEALRSRRPKGENHWRKRRFAQQQPSDFVAAIFRLASESPVYSLEKLYRTFVSQTDIALSKSAFYATLRRFDLNTAALRRAYVGERGQIGRIRNQLLTLEYPSMTGSSLFPKRDRKVLHMMTLWDYIGLLIIGFVIVSSIIVGTVAIQRTQSVGEQLFLGYQRVLSRLSVMQLPVAPEEEKPTTTPTPSPAPAQNLVMLPSVSPKDLSWGAVALNPKQSNYAPGETVDFAFGVVNPKGTTICDAQLIFSITVPSEHKTYKLTTEEGTIARSPSCSPTGVTHKADYTAQFPARLVAETYQLELETSTQFGVRTIRDQLTIGSNSFQVKRTDFPTRIYPGSPYWLGFTVTAQEDFVGEIRETVPAKDFAIRQVSSGGQLKLLPGKDGQNRFEIVWPVKLHKGQEYSFSYTMQFPPLAPELYELGAVRVHDEQGREVFTEARAWQIVADEYNLQYINP